MPNPSAWSAPSTTPPTTRSTDPAGPVTRATGERMVTARRPGMELVIAAHKSVAELGVLGRAEDMHAIMDAERDATLRYLDDLTRERGGRRGVAAVPTATTGLVYAHARHATTRAGDPGPHDHVLIANVIEMLDGKGGTKAPDTTLWREHLHAATMVGRVASAAKAVQLGYGIEADPGSIRQARALEDQLASPTPPWRSTPSAPPRSARPWPRRASPPTRPARWRPGRRGSKSATRRSRTCCRGGGPS